jgi:hypothetical protein
VDAAGQLYEPTRTGSARMRTHPREDNNQSALQQLEEGNSH